VLRRFLDETLNEGCYGAVVIFLATIGLNAVLIGKMLAALDGLRAAYPARQIVFVMATIPETRAAVERVGFRAFDEPVRAIAALGALNRIAEAWRRPPPSLPGRALRRPLAHIPRNEHDALAFLADGGIPVLPRALVASRSAAARAGCVVLGVKSRREAGEAFELIMKRARRRAPRARLEGVLVAPMVEGGVEVILGVQNDPIFGPVVMLGLGGIFVETLKDVSLNPAPIDRREAMRMIRALKGYALLSGARGRPRADVEALARALVALSRLALAYRDSIASIDINPFVVLPKGAVALDALILGQK